MSVLALGISYRRAPVELLERLAFGDEDYTKAYHHLSSLESVSESVIVSTCNRVEVYAEVARYHHGFQDLKRFLSESRDVPVEEFAEPLYSHYEDQATDHLFSVASGIDSMVLGEPQILVQVRAAVRRARTEGTAGPVLSGLFRHAVRTGRRARAETEIGASPGAFVEAGADLATKHLGGLGGRSLLVVGAGKMSSLAIQTLRDRGIEGVRVLNRTPERARRLAARAGARHGSLDGLVEGLREADLVVASTGATGVIVQRDHVEEAEAGGGRPLFILDLGVPRDVDPGIGELRGVRVADIDDLRDTVAEARAGAGDEVAAVRLIVEEETSKLAARRRAARLAPLIAALHERGEKIRARELRRAASRLSKLSGKEREAVEALTRGIVNKLLHDPVVRLKDLSGPGAGESYARTLAELFDLEEPLEDR